jgi:hypothetical protein
MIYLTGRNLGVGFHVVYVHGIWCEDDSLSGARIHHLIHREKFDRKLGNMQHILEAFVGEFNPSFVVTSIEELSPIRIGGPLHASKEE